MTKHQAPSLLVDMSTSILAANRSEAGVVSWRLEGGGLVPLHRGAVDPIAVLRWTAMSELAKPLRMAQPAVFTHGIVGGVNSTALRVLADEARVALRLCRAFMTVRHSVHASVIRW